MIECSKSRNFSLNNAPWWRKSIEVDSKQIKMTWKKEKKKKKNQCYTMWKIANILKIFNWRSENHLHQLSLFLFVTYVEVTYQSNYFTIPMLCYIKQFWNIVISNKNFTRNIRNWNEPSLKVVFIQNRWC